MKNPTSLVFAVLLMLYSGWTGSDSVLLLSAPVTENEAVTALAADMCGKGKALKGKKVSVLYFQNLEGKEVPEGRRMAERFMAEFMKCGNCTIVERSGLGDIIKAQELELSGLVDNGGSEPSGALLSVDILISGTIAQQNPGGELTVKAADVRTGEIYAIATSRFSPQEKFTYTENEKNLSLYRKEPDLLQRMNNAYMVLSHLAENKPLIFLLVMTEEGDTELEKNPRLSRRMKQVVRRSKKASPDKVNKLKRLRKGVQILRENDEQRYADLVVKKRAIIENF